VAGSSLRSPPPVPRRPINRLSIPIWRKPLPGTIQTLQKELALPGEITIETILRSPGVISASEQGVLDSALPRWILLSNSFSRCAQKKAPISTRSCFAGSDPSAVLSQKFASFSHASRSGIARSFSNVSGRSASRFFDDDRLTKDVTFFAERSDFSEELSWLESHLDQFLETTNKQPAIGRTLEFISQELGRELNTLSAKANDAEISQIVVQCKAELEKIREQVQNVE
jgi:uncharacterized protein YicC (UPF0701 family)